MIYAVDVLQIPSHVQQCCLKVIGIALEGEMMSFQIAKASAIDSTLYEEGRGLTIVISAAKIGVESS